MRFEFDPDHHAVIVSDEGLLTGERFGRWLRELSVEPDFSLDMHQIFDIGAMEGLPRSEPELDKFLLVGAGFNRGSGRIAVVAPGGFGAGLDARFEALATAGLGRDVRIFGTRAEALLWVAS